MTLMIMTLGTTTFAVTTLAIMTISITMYAKCHYCELHLIVILAALMTTDNILNGVRLSVVTVNVVAPFRGHFVVDI